MGDDSIGDNDAPTQSENDEFADLIRRVRKGDGGAVEELWNRYYASLVRIATRRLPLNLRRTADEEDVALSAFHSFVAGVQEDRFHDLSSPDNLWGLMITLTSRKVHAHIRRQTRQKRGGGAVRGESVFLDAGGESRGGGIGAASDSADAADLQMELAEAAQQLLDALPDEGLRQIAIMRMDGFLVNEIAEALDLSKRAVERRLQLIRKHWSERDAE